jgi:hypothetical protein
MLPPMSFNCPAQEMTEHSEKECPLHNLSFYKRTYIKPASINTVLYHVKFEYYDKIRQEICTVPDGLQITAFKAGSPHMSSFLGKNGVYEIRLFNIPGGTRDNDVHFAFQSKNAWVYTKDKTSQPILVYSFEEVEGKPAKTPITRDELAKRPLAERIHYYDLPESWDSRNWVCQLDQNVGEYKKLTMEITSISTPIVFCLDDIVILDSTGKQDIYDCDGLGNKKALDPNYSRVRFLIIDTKSMQLKIYEAKSNDPLAKYQISYPVDFATPLNLTSDPTKFLFQKDTSNNVRNFIRAPQCNVRAILFCGDIYDTTSKRTVADSKIDFSKGHIVGARSAIKNDKDVHFIETMHADTTKTFIHYPKIGTFDLHYLHDGAVDANQDYSFLIVYWSAVINTDTNPKNGGLGSDTPPLSQETAEFKTVGMNNAMHAWNRKRYKFIDYKGGKNRRIIKLFFLFEAFEIFNYTPPNPIDFTDDHYDVLFKRPDFKAALTNSYGGKPKTVAFITCEKKGSWVISTSSPDRQYSLADFAIKDRMENPHYLPGFPYTEFGELYKGVLALGHEIGHATGQVDDYLDQNCYAWDGTKWDQISVPTFEQWGYDSKYDNIKNDKSNFPDRLTGSDPWENKYDPLPMMCFMGPIRMRYVWRFVHWINENGKAAHGTTPAAPLHKFTYGTEFKVFYMAGNMDYHRSIFESQDPYAILHKATIKINDGAEVDVALTNDKTVSVYVYRKLDETRLYRSITNVNFKAILVLRVLMTIEFVPDTSTVPAISWTTMEKQNFAEQVLLPFTDLDHAGAKGKYCIRGGGGDYDPTFIHLLPGFEFATHASIIKSSNYHIKVKKNSADPITRLNKIISFGDTITGLELFNFFFGKQAADASFNIGLAGDFLFLEKWFRSKFGNGYKVELL